MKRIIQVQMSNGRIKAIHGPGRKCTACQIEEPAMQEDSFCQVPSVFSKKIRSMSRDYVHPIGDKGRTGAEPHKDEYDKDIPHGNECGHLRQTNIYCRYEDRRYRQKEP